MGLRLIRVVLVVACAALLSPSWALAAQPTHVVLLAEGVDWREARRIIEAHGGQVRVVLVPGVLVGDIPEGAALALQAAAPPGAAAAAPTPPRVIRTREDAEALLGTGPAGVARAAGPALSTEAQAALRLLAPQPVPVEQNRLYRVNPDGSIEVRPINEWEEPPLLRPRPQPRDPRLAQAIGNTFNNTSGFLAGDVGVGILRPESNGVAEAQTDNWTAAEVTFSLAEVTTSLNKLTNDAPRGKLTFVVRTESFGPGVAGTVDCDYEAIAHPNWTSSVVLNFLGKLGYGQANFFNRLLEWDNDIRTDLGTDWAFGVVIVDNSSNTSLGRASAYINGPGQWLFQDNTAEVYHHESGHIWGATDEYHPDAEQSPTGLWGYTQEVNANSQYNDGTGFFGGAGEGIPALQINNIDYVSPWGRGAWGIWDLDGDGTYEPQDTAPTVVLNAPTGTLALTLTGTATVTPLKVEAATFPATDADVSVNKIAGVDWRMNGGPWQVAGASDGSFNSSSEGFTFTTPTLRNGPYVFEARARDNFGNVSTFYPRRLGTASGSGLTNNVPMPALTVTPSLGSTATSFKLDATGSVDPEDSANLQYRWDFENDSVYDTVLSASPIAFHSYGTPGAKTAKVEVAAAGGTMTRTVTFTVSAANVVPTASFTVDKGSLFATSPAVFNFDASGVVDGEDATSALQVRWDFEDDGVFDTAFSTTKTIAHDYAQGLPITVSQETANTYLYSAASGVTGLAQSFVASGTGIGKAELDLAIFGELTPGGTVTVGLMSTLGTSANFLTSVTKNQASLTSFDWNTFDFPDIAVTNGATYYLVLLGTDSDVSWLASTTDTYAGGQHHFSFNAGGSWSGNASRDHVFRIYGSAPMTIPLTKSKAWRVRMEVRDSNSQTAQTVRDIWTNAYDTPPTVSLGSDVMSGTTATTFNLTGNGADANTGMTWDNFLHYRWDVNGDGNYETEFAATNTRGATFTQTGVYQATVEVRDRYHATARSSVTLTVEAAAVASRIASQAGDGQSAPLNTAVGIDPAVIVRDVSNNPVAGAVVVFRIVSGGGAVSEATQTTNASGIATVESWMLGPSPGANSLTATLPAFPGPSVTFNATATAPAPTVTTQAATLIGLRGATLNASVNPNGSATSAVFDYGTTLSYGSTTASASLGSGIVPVSTSSAVTGLVCNTQYHFRGRASNAGGSTNGSDLTFTTSACPARVFVSVLGLDTNDCSNVLTPCRTLGAAISQVATDGEVIVTKSGSYAGATIAKAVKINAASGVVAFSGQPITVNSGGGTTVVLRGLTLKAVNPGTGTGLLIQSAGAVFVENSVIDGWEFGILQQGAAEVYVKDSAIRNNSTGFYATVGKTALDNTRLTNNGIGIASDAAGIAVRGSTLSGNTTAGIYADSSSSITVDKCQITNNAAGITLPASSLSTLRLSRSVVSGNSVGLENVGGTLEVNGTNVIRGNTTNTTGTITITGQQ